MPELNGQDITALLQTYGYWAVLLLVAVESMGVPVPGETTLIAASVYAGTTHRLEIALVILAAALGAVVGDNLGYLIGREGGQRLLHRYGRYVRLNECRLLIGRYLFEQHGGKVVFFGRFVGVLRMWAAFLAGANGMPWKRFLAFNAMGGILWAGLVGMLAYGLGAAVLQVGGIIGIVTGIAGMLHMTALALNAHRAERRMEVAARCTATAEALIAA
jgi:membrane protein DedA with SNARE-associated domain